MTEKDRTDLVQKVENFLYQGNSVPEISKKLSDSLKTSNNFFELELASKLDEYVYVWNDDNYSKHLIDVFKEFFKYLSDKEPDLKFWLEARKKALLSLILKALIYQSDGLSLDMLRDLLAFRVITLGYKDSLENILTCYRIIEHAIEFFTRKGFIVCQHDPTIETSGFDNSKHNILIPSEEDIAMYSNHKFLRKDYVINPKANTGYQALHIIIRDPDTRICFEFQAKTLFMHLRAETGLSSHWKYKDERYGKYNFYINRKKIHIDGYAYDSDCDGIIDFSGLEKSQQILQRGVTY